MAKILFGALVVNARGSIGSSVYTGQRSGSVIRTKAKHTSVSSIGQRQMRAILVKASRNWQNISAADKALWETYGATLSRHDPVSGVLYTFTGYWAWHQLGIKLLQFDSQTILPSTPPAGPFAGDDTGITAIGGPGMVTFSATSAQAANTVTELFLLPVGDTIGPSTQQDYRHQAFWVADPATPFVLTAIASLRKYPSAPIPPGQYKWAWQSLATDTGQTALFFQGGQVAVT